MLRKPEHYFPNPKNSRNNTENDFLSCGFIFTGCIPSGQIEHFSNETLLVSSSIVSEDACLVWPCSPSPPGTPRSARRRPRRRPQSSTTRPRLWRWAAVSEPARGTESWHETLLIIAKHKKGFVQICLEKDKTITVDVVQQTPMKPRSEN